MKDTKDIQIRSQGMDAVIVGTMVGAAVGGLATWFLSREENRKKAVSFWDEIREETVDYANFLFRKTRTLRGPGKKLIQGKKTE